MIRYMLNTYVETEPEVSDEEFSRFFKTATHNMGVLTKQPTNTYGSLLTNPGRNSGFGGNNIMGGNSSFNRLPPGKGVIKRR